MLSFFLTYCYGVRVVAPVPTSIQTCGNFLPFWEYKQVRIVHFLLHYRGIINVWSKNAAGEMNH